MAGDLVIGIVKAFAGINTIILDCSVKHFFKANQSQIHPHPIRHAQYIVPDIDMTVSVVTIDHIQQQHQKLITIAFITIDILLGRYPRAVT